MQVFLASVNSPTCRLSTQADMSLSECRQFDVWIPQFSAGFHAEFRGDADCVVPTRYPEDLGRDLLRVTLVGFWSSYVVQTINLMPWDKHEADSKPNNGL